jgi:hypothetical protein
MIEIDMDDIYFFTGLLRGGEPILFFGHLATPRPTEAYVVEYCITGS